MTTHVINVTITADAAKVDGYEIALEEIAEGDEPRAAEIARKMLDEFKEIKLIRETP
jgi:hypothetical protein